MKSSVKDLIIEYIFGTLGFFAGLYVTTFVLSMVGVKGFSEALWFLISLIVGVVCGLLVLVRSETADNDARTAYHKAIDEGRAGEEKLLKYYRPLLDPLAAIAASLLVLIPRGALEQDFVFSLITVIPVAVLMMALRLPALRLARKNWAKEHIKK